MPFSTLWRYDAAYRNFGDMMRIKVKAQTQINIKGTLEDGGMMRIKVKTQTQTYIKRTLEV